MADGKSYIANEISILEKLKRFDLSPLMEIY